jgi:uncharacterized protein DUF6985
MPDDDDDDDELPEPVRFGRKFTLEYDGAFWTGELVLPSLKKLIDDSILVEIHSEDGELPRAIRRGFTWLLANEARVGKALVAAVEGAFPEMRPLYVEAAVPAKDLPETLTARNRAKHIDIRTLTIHDVVKGRRPYLGFEVGCTWDREHGIGVMMHGTDIVEIGGGDVSLDEWVAEKHAKRR